MKKTIIFPVLICLLLACNLLSTEPPQVATPVEQAAKLPSPTAAKVTSQPESPTATLVPTTGPVYYVGPTNCSDSGPGSAQTPFCTFETALGRLQPGDTLTIHPGLYRERLVISGLAGQPNAPIIIQGQEGVIFDGGCPTFPCGVNEVVWEGDEETGLVTVEDSQYLILRELTAQNVIAVGVSVVGGSHIMVESVIVNGTGNAGLLALRTNHLTVINNDIGRGLG